MKKSTLLRKTAYPATPQYADGFVPPAGYDYKMSVSLRSISIKVYGFDGTSWTMVHDTDGVISDYITDVSYQKYYFESKTPDQQTVRVSFMSSEDETDTHTFSFGATSATRKLHHLSDVPIYRQSQVGKFLTVMSDGTLQWLGEDESYIVPSEGGEEGGGESNAPTYPELTPVGDAAIVDGQIQTNGGYFSALWSDFVSFTGNTPDNTDFTVAFWWKHGETPFTPANQWQLVQQFGLFNGRTNSMNQGMSYFIRDHNASGIRLQTNFGPSYFAGRENMVSKDANVEHPWNHFVLTRTATTTKTYWNGVLVANHGANFPWVPNSATAQLQLGATDENGANSGSNTLFEDFEIRDGDAMSAADVTALYDAGRSGAVAPAGPTPTMILEDLARLNIPNGIYTDNGSGQPHRLNFNLNGDNIISYGADGQHVEEEFTISWWMNLNSSQDAGTVSVLGNYSQPNRFALKVGGAITSNAHITTQIGTQTMFNNNSGIAIVGDWVHGAYTCKSDGSNLTVSLYINGTKLPGTKSFALGTKLLPSTSNDVFAFGGNGMSGKSAKGQFDSMQIEDGIALTDAQVAAIAAQTDREMKISEASQL